ncbi:MAG: sigma-70 family RNA polymerase sigma factor [Candidatus Sumerlaeia bacterium]|nr:sigma-70 family RNA polymerase sigma factor [Candidatus Sumerlaeia bacterium]
MADNHLDMAWRRFLGEPNDSTFAPLFEEVRADVYTIARRILGSHEDAVEAFQETFTRLLARLDGEKGAWLEMDPRQVVRRLAVLESDNLRKRRNRRAGREIPDEEVEAVVDQSLNPREAAGREEVRRRVEAMVEQLPEHERLAIFLHYFHGMTHREIADALNIPPGTVSARIARGTRRLERPLKRAGFGGVAGVLAGLTSGTTMMVAPVSLTAASVYTTAVTASAVSTIPSLVAGVTLMKIKYVVAAVAVVCVLATVAVVTLPSERNAGGIGDGVSDAVSVVHPAEGSEVSPTHGDDPLYTDEAQAGGSMEVAVAASEEGGENAEEEGTEVLGTASVFGVIRYEGTMERAADVPVSILGFEPTTTTTNARGEYLLEGLPEGAGRILAQTGNFRSIPVPGQSGDVTLLEGERTGPVDLLLREATAVAGRVLDAYTEEPIDGVHVHLEGNNEVYTDETAEGGVYLMEALDPGNYHVRFQKEGYLTLEASFLATTEHLARRDYHLHRKGSLTIRVVDEEGHPVEGGRLINLAVERTPLFFDIRMTDERGVVEVHEFPRGVTLPVMVTHMDFPEPASEEFTFPYDEEESELVLTMEGRVDRTVLEGVVLESETEVPIAEASVDIHVRLSRRGPQSGSRYSSSAIPTTTLRTGVTDAEGRFRVEVEGDATHHHLIVVHREYKVFELADVPMGTVEEPGWVDVQLEPGGIVTGRVVDPEGDPVPDVRIMVPDSDTMRIRMSDAIEWKTDELGRFEVGTLGKESMVLVFSKEGYNGNRREGINAGDHLDIVMEPVEESNDIVFRGKVVDKETGDTVREFTVSHALSVLREFEGGMSSMSGSPISQSFSTDDGEFTLDIKRGNRTTRSGDPSEKITVSVMMTVQSQGYRQKRMERFDIADDESEVERTIELSSRSTLQGRVVDATDGAGIPGAVVKSVGREDRHVIVRPGAVSGDTTTDESGHFEIQVSGPEDIRVHAEGYARTILPHADVVRAIDEEEAVFLSMEPGATVRLDWDVSARVGSVQVHGGGLGIYGFPTHPARNDGQYVIGELPAVEGARLSAASHSDGFRDGGWALDWPVVLEPGAELRFRASEYLAGGDTSLRLDPEGFPHIGSSIHISIQSPGEDPAFRVSIRPHAELPVTLPALQPGTYTVRLHIGGGSGRRDEPLSTEMYLDPAVPIVLRHEDFSGSP